MKIGSVLHHKYFNGVINDERRHKYRQIVKTLFSSYGMFGSGMMRFITLKSLNTSGYDLHNVDKIVEFGLNNNLEIHYNTVLTGRIEAMPDQYKFLSRHEKLAFLENHVRFIVNRYKGKVAFYKLINEVTRESDVNYLETGLNKVNLLTKIFKWAVDTNPEGKYMINEHGVIIREEIREPFLDIIENIRDGGGRIDIIGIQGHMGYYPRPSLLPTDEYILNSFNIIKQRLKIPIYITEFDVNSGNNLQNQLEVDGKFYQNWYEYQKYAYKHFVQLCEESGLIDHLFYWSLVDDPDLIGERHDVGLYSKDFISKKYLT